jgi:nitrogen-specific signal transduction histidine kinase
MRKVSNEKSASVLKHASVAIRTLTARCSDLTAKLAHYELQDHSRKVAAQMLEKGLSDETLDKLAGQLAQEPERLGNLEQAVALVGPNMGKVAHVLRDGTSGGAVVSDLERYLLGQLPDIT